MLDIMDSIPDGFYISTFSRSKETILRGNHEHNFHEVYFLLKGSARHFIHNEIINMQCKEFVIIKKGYLHKTMYDPGDTTERMMICFSDEFIGPELAPILEELGRKKYMKLSPLYALEMEKLAQKLYNEYYKKDSYYLEICKSLTKELLIHFYRQNLDVPQTKLTAIEQIIQNIAKYIAENYHLDLPLSLLAEKSAMSPGHLSRTFKTVTGFGIHEYISMIRLSNAEMLLKSGEYNSITDVALKCGYSDSNYFTSVFRKKWKMTPRQYSLMTKETHKNT